MSKTELGATLRRWRDHVTPAAAGLAAGRRRRAPGLRREELADLAGLSIDYVVRLEQGRSSSPSAPVVEALARALRLDADRRTHLFELAGLAAPGPEIVPSHISPSVHRLVDRHAEMPVAVFDAAWNQLLSNRLYDTLMGAHHDEHRNALWRCFVSGIGRVRHTPESLHALRLAQAADLRRTAARYPDDRGLQALIARLRRSSATFERLWNSGVVGEHTSAHKIIGHPGVGDITLDCDILTVAGSELRIMIYSAEPGTADADRLDLLAVLGHQDMRSSVEAGGRTPRHDDARRQERDPDT